MSKASTQKDDVGRQENLLHIAYRQCKLCDDCIENVREIICSKDKHLIRHTSVPVEFYFLVLLLLVILVVVVILLAVWTMFLLLSSCILVIIQKLFNQLGSALIVMREKAFIVFFSRVLIVAIAVASVGWSWASVVCMVTHDAGCGWNAIARIVQDVCNLLRVVLDEIKHSSSLGWFGLSRSAVFKQEFDQAFMVVGGSPHQCSPAV